MEGFFFRVILEKIFEDKDDDWLFEDAKIICIVWREEAKSIMWKRQFITFHLAHRFTSVVL